MVGVIRLQAIINGWIDVYDITYQSVYGHYMFLYYVKTNLSSFMTKYTKWLKGVKKSLSPFGFRNRQQEYKGMQRHDQHYFGLLSHDNKPHDIRT